MKALYFSLALALCGVLFGTASGCVVDFPDELPYTCEADSDCGGSPHVCASLADGRKYCCKPETELCNRLDDDCNGVPDDLSTEFCYTGPEETRNVGACRQGRPSCGNGGTVLCGGEVLPTAEACNGKDDDCDGTVDEGFDFQTGRNNCGRCDQICENLQDCVAGQCVRRRETTCDNNQDDDTDDLRDCADPDCNSLPCGEGCTCLGGRKAETNCVNGVSDEGAVDPEDANNLVDCADPDCESRSCSTTGTGCICLGGKKGEGDCINTVDGTPTGTPVDDDGDTFANCADQADCTDKSCGDGCVCRGGVKAEDLCDDGLDNDLDGTAQAPKTDCQDADCTNKLCGLGCLCANLTKKEVVCSDGLDNDGDSAANAPRTDCQDADCNGQVCSSGTDTGGVCTSNVCKEIRCGDQTDNDRDGLQDCADPDCLNQSCGSGNRRCQSSGACQ